VKEVKDMESISDFEVSDVDDLIADLEAQFTSKELPSMTVMDTNTCPCKTTSCPC
jgi:hypothetical protein